MGELSHHQIKHISLEIPPEIAFDALSFESYCRKKIGIFDEPIYIQIQKRSIDARNKVIKIGVEVLISTQKLPPRVLLKPFLPINPTKKIIIVGAGPAGIFAGIRALELGWKPIILEQGKDVRARRFDLAAITKHHIVNPESNYCFGEGGAGTYSDGKLYTRSKKKDYIKKVLECFVAHGAEESILYEARPHIGTNKLPKIITSLRQTLLENGGEIHFSTKVTDLLISQNQIKGVIAHEKEWTGEAVILATGHSSRDIFELLSQKNITIEAKPFAMGVRIEHEQSLINKKQYGEEFLKHLPAAYYTLATEVAFENRKIGVFSFCMCPGGYIVPSATAPNELVVNGMSPSRRDSKFANSGLVVSVDDNSWKKYKDFGALAGLYFQKEIEQLFSKASKGLQTAPAQGVQDFLAQKHSQILYESSYIPGLLSCNLSDILPECIDIPLKKGLVEFGQKIKGYLDAPAQLIGLESRTSSPIRIPRNEKLEHIKIKKLYPCAEGAGYAGGIMSAAIDGIRCVEEIIKNSL